MNLHLFIKFCVFCTNVATDLKTFSMNNEIRHVTWGFGNVWISLSTFSSIGLKETHPQTSNVF